MGSVTAGHPAQRLRLAQSRNSSVPGDFPAQWNAIQVPAVSVKPARFASSMIDCGDVRSPTACSAVPADISARRPAGRSRLEHKALAQSKSTVNVDSRLEVQ